MTLAPTNWADGNTVTAAAMNALGSIINNTADVFNVKAYGAVGDNSNDDTTAIQAAITAAGNGVVYFPAGTYKITAALTLGTSGATLQGAGFEASIIHQATAGTHGFYAQNHREFVFRDLKITGQGTGNGDGIYLSALTTYAVFDCVFDNVFISGFGRHGIHTEDLCVSTFRHVRVEGCGTDGFHVDDNGSSNLGGTSLSFTSCYANSCGGAGFYIGNLTYSTFTSCASDACLSGYKVKLGSGLSFVGCGTELTTGTGHGFWITDGTVDVTMLNCITISVAGVGFFVDMNSGNNVSRISLINCRSLGSTTPTYSAQIGTGCQAVMIGFCPHPSAGLLLTGTTQLIAHNNTAQTNLLFNVAGAVSDGSFSVAPPAYTMAIDTTNHRLYIRDGSTWRYTTLT